MIKKRLRITSLLPIALSHLNSTTEFSCNALLYALDDLGYRNRDSERNLKTLLKKLGVDPNSIGFKQYDPDYDYRQEVRQVWLHFLHDYARETDLRITVYKR
jgi:hypothetical protein